MKVLVVPFSEEFDSMNLDADYARAFMPAYAETRNLEQSNAFIYPIDQLQSDQILILQERGAFEADAEEVILNVFGKDYGHGPVGDWGQVSETRWKNHVFVYSIKRENWWSAELQCYQVAKAHRYR